MMACVPVTKRVDAGNGVIVEATASVDAGGALAVDVVVRVERPPGVVTGLLKRVAGLWRRGG